MDKLDLSAGKSALGSIKEAKNLGKEFGGMITDEQAENERLIQAQHKKRIEEKKYEDKSDGEKAAYRKKIKEEKRRKKHLRRKRKMG